MNGARLGHVARLSGGIVRGVGTGSDSSGGGGPALWRRPRGADRLPSNCTLAHAGRDFYREGPACRDKIGWPLYGAGPERHNDRHQTSFEADAAGTCQRKKRGVFIEIRYGKMPRKMILVFGRV